MKPDRFSKESRKGESNIRRINLSKICLFLIGFCIADSNLFAATNIPSQAWSRDIGSSGYVDGAPIGGFGAGTITWDLAGDFYLGRLNIANAATTTTTVPYPVDTNCKFYMYQKPSGQSATVELLDASTLGSGVATYYSLFPKAWVGYTGSLFTCPATVTQFSPIMPQNVMANAITLSTYPEGIYEWDLSNPTAISCDVAVMLTFDNTFGGTTATVNTSGNNTGLVLHWGAGPAANQNQGEFTIATQSGTGITVSYQSASSVAALQTAFTSSGLLNNTTGANSIGGIAFKATLAPGQEIKIPIVLTWDIPLAKPGTGATWYREYTRTYGKTGTNSFNIANDALNNYSTWESDIDTWQNSILTGPYPTWLQQMLFNELYYYFTGGTIWEAGQYGNTTYNAGPDMFSSLESYIYDYYGTSDVRFYGSWPLAMLWPSIDKQEVEQFCDSVVVSPFQPLPRPAAIGTCAHDFGDVNGIFAEWNAYTYRNSTIWKDLNSKLVLMVYRAYELTGKTDTTFLNYCWPAVQTAMTNVHNQCDANGLPNISATDANVGADCTYDDMGLNGDSAYCGGLFLAACEAAQAMATSEGNTALATTYQTWLTTGQTGFATLWNGSYYNIDNGATDTAQNRIMVDQLSGQWYAKALGLPSIVPDANAISAWQKVHDNNWKLFDSGTHGAVNCMTSAGAIDTSWPQSQEAWVGVNWGAASGMVLEGMYTQATDVGYSLYNSIWNLGQLWFRTPEAWQTGLSNVRAPYYMRANAVWAVKYAYDIGPAPCGALTCTPTFTFTPTSTPNPCASVYEAINCGGPQTIISGVTWKADQAYTTGGFGYVTAGLANTVTNTIANSGAQQALYQSERYATPLEYKFTVPNGSYLVTLKNAELYWTAAGDRVFSVAINGTTVLSNFDIFSQVGEFVADDHSFMVNVTGGLIDIVATATVDNAQFGAIEITSETVCTPSNTPTQTATNSPTRTPTNSPTNTVTNTATLTATNSATNTATNTITGTPPAATNTSTNTPSSTMTNTSTGTATSTATYTPTNTASSTATNSATDTVTQTSSNTASYSPTNTATQTTTNTPTLTPVITSTFTNTVTNTSSSTATNSPTTTASSTATHSPTNTATQTITNTPTLTSAATSTFMNTMTNTASSTATKTSTSTASLTATNSPTITATKTATNTATNSATFSSTSSPTHTATNTATSSATYTATTTVTVTSTYSKTNTPTATSTNTPTSTATNTLTPVPTFTRTNTPTITPTYTPTSTYTPTITQSVVISQPYPNPSSGSPITFNVQTPDQSTVTLDVFTLAFRKIYNKTVQVYGSQNLQWDLRDNAGVQAADGLYYVRVHVAGTPATTKILKVLILR